MVNRTNDLIYDIYMSPDSLSIKNAENIRRFFSGDAKASDLLKKSIYDESKEIRNYADIAIERWLKTALGSIGIGIFYSIIKERANAMIGMDLEYIIQIGVCVGVLSSMRRTLLYLKTSKYSKDIMEYVSQHSDGVIPVLRKYEDQLKITIGYDKISQHPQE